MTAPEQKQQLTVLHILSDPLPGGIEVFLLNLLKQQSQREPVRNIVVCIQDADAPASLRKEYEKVAEFRDLDCESFFSLKFCGRLRQLLREENPDVLHAWCYDIGLVAGLIGRFLHGIKVVWAIHAMDLPSRDSYGALKFNVLKMMVGIGSRFIPHRILSCSDKATDAHVRFGYPRKRCKTIANGIDTDRFQPNVNAADTFRSEYAIPKDAPLVGYVGRSHPVKNLELLFEAAALLMEKRKDVYFAAVGLYKETLYPAAREAFDKLADPSRFIFVGNRPDVENCLPAFTINTLSSKSEAQPMVLMEALAAGVPSVTTDVGSSALVVGSVGRSVPSGNAQGLADSISNLLNEVSADPQKWRTLARQRAVEHFSIATSEKKHTCEYSSLAGIQTSQRPYVMHLVNNLDFGGAESILHHLACGLQRKGLEQRVVSLMPPGRLSPVFEESGIQTKSLDVRGPFSGVWGVFRLAAHIRRENPDVIQTWLFHSALVGQVAALLSLKSPKVFWSIHHTTLDKNSSKLPTRVIRRILALISRFMPDRIIYCSSAGVDAHVSAGFSPSKTTLIYNGTDTETFTPNKTQGEDLRRDLGIDAKAPVIGIVGRFDPLKNFPNMLRAFSLIQEEMPDAHLIACGPDMTQENSELQDLVNNCPVPSQIHLLGARMNMHHNYPAFTLTASSSTQEAFPMILGESMACGVPCVATDVGDCSVIIGDTGRLVPTRNSRALADGILELLNLPEAEILKLGSAARERILTNFTMNRYVRLHEELYRNLDLNQRMDNHSIKNSEVVAH